LGELNHPLYIVPDPEGARVAIACYKTVARHRKKLVIEKIYGYY
jgi:hypothetical protein